MSNQTNQMTNSAENAPVHENNHQLATQSERYRPFGFEEPMNDAFRAMERFSERLGFPSSFFSDPFFNSEDNFGFGNRLAKLMEPFGDEFKNFGGSSSFFGRDNGLSQYTEKLFEEFSNKKEGEEMEILSEDPNDEFLQHPKELEDLYSRFKSEGSDSNSVVTGRSYVSSTICKNGKSITVSKHSELTPDGMIKTRLDQRFKDNEGHEKSKSWVKDLSLKGDQPNMIQDIEN